MNIVSAAFHSCTACSMLPTSLAQALCVGPFHCESSPTTDVKKAASLRTLGMAMRSGFLMPICFNSPMNTLRRDSVPEAAAEPHLGMAPASFSAFMAASTSALYSSFCRWQV